MNNEHIKICQASLAIKEKQIKTSMRYYFPPNGMATNKQKKT